MRLHSVSPEPLRSLLETEGTHPILRGVIQFPGGTKLPGESDADSVQVAKPAQSAPFAQLGAVCLVYQGKPAAEGYDLPGAVLAHTM